MKKLFLLIATAAIFPSNLFAGSIITRVPNGATIAVNEDLKEMSFSYSDEAGQTNWLGRASVEWGQTAEEANRNQRHVRYIAQRPSTDLKNLEVYVVTVVKEAGKDVSVTVEIKRAPLQ